VQFLCLQRASSFAETFHVSTSRGSRRQTQLSPIETQLDGDDGGDLPRPSWEDRFSELAEYHRIDRHCNVPQRTKLGSWVSKQKNLYKLHREGKKSPMTLSRIQKLESLSFEWDNRGTTWGKRLSELADYRKIYGHCNVPVRYSENLQLGMWAAWQRRKYKLHREEKKSSMTNRRIQALKRLGFE
jgi:hypothetical protein